MTNFPPVALRAVGLMALTLAGTPLAAQGPTPIETDRPDFTESASTISRGRFQLEAGYTLQRSAGGVTSTHSLPETLLRIGLPGGVEARVGQNLQAAGGRADFADLALGAKVALADQDGARPQLAVLLQSTLPTGGDRLSAGKAVPSASLLAAWELNSAWSAGASVLASREPNDQTTLAASAAVGRQIVAGWRGFAEWFTIQPIDAPVTGSGVHYLNGGVTRSLSPLVQLDARIGVGVGGAADRYFVGLGLAVGW